MKSKLCRVARRLPQARLLALLVPAVAAAPIARADITYTLQFDPASSGEAQQVANSVAVAAAFYNQNGSFNKHWDVYYNPGIPTAEANYTGYMGFGGSRNERVVFHEASHTFGMGTHGSYPGLIAGGLWKGKYGNQAQADTYNDFADGLHGDGHAIWPGGFNYDNEDGYLERFWQTRIMAGIRADMGILSFTREARNEAVVTGETAVFQVESPVAYSWQWYKNGVALANGGDISGASSATLRIANADASDAGSYYCAATGGNETLNSRTRQLWVHATPQLGQWDLNGNANDSLNGNHGTAFGTPLYTTGKIGQAVDLDGIDDYIDLPDPIGRTADLTIATWVNWDGGADWQRVFDFGTGTYQYLFLTPKAGGGGLRLALRDPIHGKDVEYQVNAPALATGQWVHLAATLRDNYMTLYMNGQAVGSAFDLQIAPADFPATNNYIGKSQFADPLFNGRVDDFRVYGKALKGAEIWSLWGQSANQAPVFSTIDIILPGANALQPYTGQTIAPYASDADANPLTFTKLYGPSWLNVAANGSLSGQPSAGINGDNTFIVRVTDPSGASSDATLHIDVFAPQAAPVTASATAPAIDADDVYYFASNIGEPDTIDGTTFSGDNDASTYVAEDRWSKGQTFTTGSNPQGYFFQSFTFQHVNWPALTNNGTYYDIQPGDQWELQIGTMSGTTKTPLLNYTAAYDGAALTGSGNSGSGRYLTFNVSGMGVQLAPNTTYYFEVAPLSGDPYFELNSSRNGTFAGGTAYRGSALGTISTGVTPLTGDYIFHANLEAKPAATSGTSTIAYWNFEEGVANAYVPYARSNSGLYDGSIIDQSGNANHLSVWGGGWHWYRPLVPAPATPQTAGANTLSLQNANGYPAISATGTSLTDWSPTQWTIEAAIRPDDATNGFQTFIGRDSFGGIAGEPALAAIYFTVRPDGALRFMFADAAGNKWDLVSAANAIQDAKWHAVAATSNGSTLSLYVKNLTNGDANYTLVGTLNLSASTNPALSTGTGTGSGWQAGDITVGRGLYNGSHTDRFFGHIDDVRLSNTALPVSQLLYSPPAGQPPSNPAGLVATAGSASQINLSWAAAAGATGYNVKRSATSGGPYSTIAPAITGTSFGDTGLSASTAYYYVVSALNGNGESGNSSEASATTLAPPPVPWSAADIGAAGIPGTASHSAGVFTVKGSGTDISGTADAFHFVSQPLTGDGEIRARVTSQSNSDPWAKAGVMIRDGSGSGAVNSFIAATPGNGFTFQSRSAAAGTTSSTAGPALNAMPNNWVRLTRSGTLVTAYVSANGTAWTQLATTTLSMSNTVSVGLAVTSHNNAVLGSATFDNVAVTPFPSPWQTANVGTTGLQGGAEYFPSAFTVKGAGVFGGTSDGFRFVYQTINGNGTIIARVSGLQDTGLNARVGIMFRDTLAANARMAALTVNGSGAWRWQRRTLAGGSTSTTNSSSGTAPDLWVKLARSGSTITASRSTNGTAWTTIGSATVSMATTCYVGLVNASGTTTTLNTSVIDNVGVTASAALLDPGQDADADGLADAWESLYYNPAQYGPANDLDGDGQSNSDEYVAGTSPTNGSDAARLRVLSTSPARFEFNGKAARTYSLERAASLDSGEWQQIESVGPLTTDGIIQVTDPAPLPDRGFYRLQIGLSPAP
jgi:regulation of enolase protein 1 (concanavalin A-like superfamily)